MADNPGTVKNSLAEWLKQNFPSGYTSCIKIHGRPILPPLMSEERRREMRHLRDIAVEVENRLIRKKRIQGQEDSTCGEAMYEGLVDELHFANSLPTSLAANSEECTQPMTSTELCLAQQEDISQLNQTPSIQTTCDLLKEFDPLAEKNSVKSVIPANHHLDFNPGDFSENINKSSDKTISKPSSAESSVALSHSTDLNNYMDITEGSIDVSTPCAEVRSGSGTRATTPSTIQSDTPSTKSQLNVQWSGKTTYEDLNNYLDSLLNNSIGSKKLKPIKDSNQNVVNTSSSSQSSQRTISPPSLPEGSQLINNPPPLTSPQGSLQTRIVTDNNYLVSATAQSLECVENSSNFLQNCALSPVVRSGIQNSYEQKVQLYLQNLVVDEGIIGELSQKNTPQSPDVETNVKETKSSKNLVNGEVPPSANAESNFNGCVQAAPRLVRSNSYTLDSPSPMLLAHMEAESRKTVGNEPIMGHKPSATQNLVPSRRVWDVENNSTMPSWCNRQSNVSSINAKTQSPKKVLNQSASDQPSVPGNLERRVPPDNSQKLLWDKVATKCGLDQPESRTFTESGQKETAEKSLDSSVQARNTVPPVNDDVGKVRTLLLQLQLQHNQEMEELLNRQRKEKEAVRLALLEEQKASPLKSTEKSHGPINSRANSRTTGQSQSPPTKDKVLMEQRNTSPSIYDKENVNEMQTGLIQYNKISSVPLDDVSTSVDCAHLIDTGKEERGLNKVVPYRQGGRDIQRAMTASGYCEYQTMSPNSCRGSTDMIASFPPSGFSSNNQLESMTSSLPPEILSLHFSNAELTFKNSNSVSCTAQSSSISINKSVSVSADVASVAQNIITSAFASNVTGGSPRSKRRSWCSRQLFPSDFLQSNPDWVTHSYEVQRHQAAAKIQAGVRGYLTRRLLKTERVQNCITTIRDTIVCALELQRECAPHVEPSDLQLHGRLIQQLSAACEDLHHIFMGLPILKRMAIIAADRERLRVRTPRSQSSVGSRPLSRATEIARQRKLNQTDPTDSSSVHSRGSSTNRSRRRSWATVESRVKASPLPVVNANNCEVVLGCLSRSSAPTSLPLQRSASAGSSRKPWR